MQRILILFASLQLAYCSSISVEWSLHSVSNAQAYILDYSPPVGIPPAGTSLAGDTNQIDINGTIPATDYTVYLSAVMMDGSRRNVTEISLTSSPDAPILDSIETTEHEATISYFPPQGNDISYYIEYYPEGHQEYANNVETKASLVRLRGLDSGTTFKIKVRSIYKGVRSVKAIEDAFTTQGNPTYDYSSSSAETFSVRTLPPDFDLATTVESTYYETSKERDTTASSVSQPPTTESFYTYEVSAEVTESPKPTIKVFPSGLPSASSGTSSSSSSSSASTSSSGATVLQTSRTSPTTTTTETTTTSTKSTTTTPSTTSSSTARSTRWTTTTEDPIEEEEVEEEPSPKDEDVSDQGEETGQVLVPIEKMKREYGEPAHIDISEENGRLRLDWTVPDGSPCDAFFVNYTILSLSRPKSFSIATSEEFAVLKMFSDHTLDLRVFCMLAGSLSKTWWAQRIAYLAKPKQISKFRVVSTETNEFYVASVILDWDWPTVHNFNLYKIIVSYRQGKGPETDREVTEVGAVNITGLEAANNYKFSVRNESTELNLISKISTLDQITPPLISSTLYPGQISSTAININFGESDPEQGKFDHYVLTFSGNNKNFTKRIEMNQERSLTFTKLIPGKTYRFSLYTVYKGVRSRPVIEDVTTYPLKVNQLFPVVGRDYVILYWDIENFADSDCRFRVSHSADKLPTVSVELKGASRHRFSGLLSETYYTFTITVIMGVGKAAAESESEMITVAIPKGRTVPTVQRQGSRELSVQFENDHNVFTSLNGALENFAIIVSDDSTLNDDNYELRSWFEVKDEEVWGSYRASPSDWNPFSHGGARQAVFTIGSDDCVRRSLDEPYCNGILRANVDYVVKIRAYADSKIAMETDWTAIDGVVGEDDEDEDKNERRLPCHMYLNGCPRKSSQPHRTQFFLVFIPSVFFFIHWRLLL